METPEIDQAPEMLEGTVMGAGGGFYEVDVPEEGARREPLLCALGGRLKNPKKERRKFSQPVSVGDRVRVRVLETSGADARGRLLREGFIEEVLPRTSQLSRSRYNKTAQITVANLDQVVVVMAARDPDINPHRLDRFLVLAEANDLKAVVCFNKIDLMKPREQKKELQPFVKLYEKLGYQIILTSAERGKDTGTKELRAALKDHISAFIGSSGVGKSSLVMMVEPKLQLWIGEVMEIGKGRHTTTDVSLHPLARGGYIADTPGVKTVTLLETAGRGFGSLLSRIRADFEPVQIQRLHPHHRAGLRGQSGGRKRRSRRFALRKLPKVVARTGRSGAQLRKRRAPPRGFARRNRGRLEAKGQSFAEGTLGGACASFQWVGVRNVQKITPNGSRSEPRA